MDSRPKCPPSIAFISWSMLIQSVVFLYTAVMPWGAIANMAPHELMALQITAAVMGLCGFAIANGLSNMMKWGANAYLALVVVNIVFKYLDANFGHSSYSSNEAFGGNFHTLGQLIGAYFVLMNQPDMRSGSEGMTQIIVGTFVAWTIGLPVFMYFGANDDNAKVDNEHVSALVKAINENGITSSQAGDQVQAAFFSRPDMKYADVAAAIESKFKEIGHPEYSATLITAENRVLIRNNRTGNALSVSLPKK